MANVMPFRHVIATRPRRSVFNNSYYKVFDCNLGQLIPVMCDLTIPGDHFRISCEDVVRANPLASPLMHRIDIKEDYFWVPLNLLWPKPEYKDLDDNPIPPLVPEVPGSWEEFISGGNSGKWKPGENFVQPKWETPNLGLHQLWDYFGLPVPTGSAPWDGVAGRKVNAYMKRAYNLVYNEYYRDPNLENPIDLDTDAVQVAKYEKDYFTSALPEPGIRGAIPTIPLTGIATVDFNLPSVNPLATVVTDKAHATNGNLDLYGYRFLGGGGSNITSLLMTGTSSMDLQPQGTGAAFRAYATSDTNNLLSNNNSIDLSNVGALTINDFRRINAIQIYLERSMRAGSRYTEFLMAHWGVHNNDLRLRRPDYIGGVRSPIIISEVLQTSKTEGNQALGYMGGHGIGVDNSYIGSYYCPDYGIIIGIMRLMPKPVYQQGVDRQWLYDDRFEYPTVELSNIGEQEVLNMELVATNNAAFNTDIFGFQGRHDEMRWKRNMVCGVMRNGVANSLGHWHLARYFDTANAPALNKQFLDVTDDGRYKAVTALPGFIVTHGNRVRRVAPLPAVSVPQLLLR